MREYMKDVDQIDEEELHSLLKGKNYAKIVTNISKYMTELSSGDNEDDDEIKSAWNQIMNNAIIIQ